ncbi:hypothetical protein Glove_71g77 [Diversispora epigaea]|uniref:Uncharacterized protein n=1 Tax=Diversispora epigaea TaxID=1348612 RepID=A0A397JKL1_9GLOM|nr:hypothetical protein Glove_71g77 [Diversispora epigaea]
MEKSKEKETSSTHIEFHVQLNNDLKDGYENGSYHGSEFGQDSEDNDNIFHLSQETKNLEYRELISLQNPKELCIVMRMKKMVHVI